MRTDAEGAADTIRIAALTLEVDRLTRQRDRARDIAVALEGQVAAVRALAEEWDAAYPMTVRFPHGYAADLRAALDPDPADHGTGERP